jgi:hypothetical protein
MGRVNSQRERGPKERQNDLRPRNVGQQLEAENSFISRDFSRNAAPGETVVTIVSWRRERNCRQTLFCNRAARVKGSKLAPAPRMMVWQGATLLSEVGACGRRKLESGKGPVHQSPRPRGRRSSKLGRSPRRVCRCHRCPASLPDASAGAELVRSPRACSVAPGPVAVLAVDPIVGNPHLGGRASRRAKPPAQPALALTPEPPDAAL